jgi:hypothetical protein
MGWREGAQRTAAYTLGQKFGDHGPKPMAHCAWCKHCAPTGTGSGECRRRAPGQYMFGQNLLTRWPRVEWYDFCGEFEMGGNASDY